VPSRIAGRWAAGLTAFLLIGSADVLAEKRAEPCAKCHGKDGISVKEGVPSLAGQPKVFLENYLVLTREGLRGSDEMRTLLRGMRDPDIVALANHYSRLAPRSLPGLLDKALYERGRRIAVTHHCGTCHVKDFSGQQQMPRLAGQREDFLAEAMLAYRQNRRPGGDTVMAASLHGIPESDLKALAHYLSRLK
jgi:cytochrome c553